MTYQAIVLHSGGMDSSICLALAVQTFGHNNVLSFGFSYNQRHSSELEAAQRIADFFHVDRKVCDMPPMLGWHNSSLINTQQEIAVDGSVPNTAVPGRNGLFIMMAAPFAYDVRASHIYVGVLGVEGSYSGYRDCSPEYIKAIQHVLVLDYDRPIHLQTPLLHVTKENSLEIADSLGVLERLLDVTVTCYRGIPQQGCLQCPACQLRNRAVLHFYTTHPEKPRPSWIACIQHNV